VQTEIFVFMVVVPKPISNSPGRSLSMMQTDKQDLPLADGLLRFIRKLSPSLLLGVFRSRAAEHRESRRLSRPPSIRTACPSHPS
jgi:hypothetical protein